MFLRKRSGVKRKVVFKRAREILGILIKYGFSEIIHRLRIGPLSFFPFKRVTKRTKKELSRKPFPFRLRLALEELGPTFIKFGQMLSMRPDVLPADIIKELQKLQDQVPPFPLKQAKETIISELQKPLKEIFKEFSSTPDAAASIAQVYKAVLHDGKTVAVKVQRPDIENHIQIDMEIIIYLADLANKYIPEIALLNPVAIVQEFAKGLYTEIDFIQESRNIDSFRKFFSSDDTIRIPAVVHENSTKKVLVMDYIEGIKISEIDTLVKNGYDTKQIAQNVMRASLKQIFDFGFFHADPHAGNIFVLPGNIVAPVDFGIIGFININLRRHLGRAFKAFIDRNGYQFVKVLRDLELVEESHITRDLYNDIEYLINYYYNMSLYQIQIGSVIFDFIEIIRKYHVQIPADLVLLGKAVAAVETVGKNLDPEINIAEMAGPIVQKSIIDSVSPVRQVKEFGQFLIDSNDLLRELPDEIRTILKKVRQDKLKFNFELTGLDYFIKEMDKASNRLSFSIIIAAFLIGSSFVTQYNEGPTVLGIPVFGFIGFAAAGLLGILLLFAIIRSGRL